MDAAAAAAAVAPTSLHPLVPYVRNLAVVIRAWFSSVTVVVRRESSEEGCRTGPADGCCGCSSTPRRVPTVHRRPPLCRYHTHNPGHKQITTAIFHWNPGGCTEELL